MINEGTQPHLLRELKITVNLEELEQKIQTGSKNPGIFAAAEKVLHRVDNIWSPSIVYRWLPFEQNMSEQGKNIIQDDTNPVVIDLGHSSKFVNDASHVLLAAYSAGNELEAEAQKASGNQEILDAYFLDLIGLLVLEKTGNIVKKIAEDKAADLGWGVSPFLSPGSVHGWNLTDQHKLCSLLPLEEIGLRIRADAVLEPFKSLTCLIGIGCNYSTASVGTTCQVCSKSGDCQMKHH